jgi:anaerobic glycerol-3-phosphate dehydrogenase
MSYQQGGSGTVVLTQASESIASLTMRNENDIPTRHQQEMLISGPVVSPGLLTKFSSCEEDIPVGDRR